MRKLAIGIGIFIVLIVGGFLVFAATLNVNKYHQTIQSELEKALGRRVSLGDMQLGLFPPRFRVQELAVGDDPQFSADAPFIRAQEVDVSIKLWPLLHKQVEISSLDLTRPSVNFIKNSAGVWNVASLGHPSESSLPADTPNNPASKTSISQQTPTSSTPTSSAQQQFSLGELIIRDGQISVLDQQKSKTPSLYDHLDVTVRNFSADQPFTLDAAVHMAGTGSQEARLKGEGGPIVSSKPEATPFRGTLNLNQVKIGDLSKFLNSPALNGTDGVMTGETKISNQSGKITAQGETQIQNGKLHGMELGFPISAQYDLTNDLGTSLLTIQNLILKLGSTPLAMKGTVESKPTPALLDLNVKAGNISIAEAAKLAAAAGVALSQGTSATGNVNADIVARGPADKPALSGTIDGSNIQLSGKEISQPVQIPAVRLNLTPSQIQSNAFNVVSGGTTLNTQFVLRDYLAASPIIDATVRAPNAQLPAILAIAKAYGVTALDKVNGAGTLNLNMHAVGPLKSVTAADIMRALNGNMDVDFNNVKYSGANVSHELASLAGFLNGNTGGAQSTEGITNILKMTGTVVVKNGIAQTNNLQAHLDVGNIGTVGTANLVDNTLNLRLTAVFSQAVSQKVGGNGVGGFMQTALANSQGELVVPALVTGTFASPKFAPDLQQIAQMKMKGLVPNLNNPASVTGALQNLLGGVKNPAPTAQPAGQQQNQPQNAVQQLIGVFGKKKKPAQEPPK